MRRTAGFLRTFLRDAPAAGTREEEITIRVGDEEREATLFLPPGRGPHPGWVVLQGLTVHGRRHPSMRRFVHALAGSGAAVLVPEVPAWSRLEIDVTEARRTLAAGVLHLSERPEVHPGGVGAIGFSFGATQAVMAAADPAVHGKLKVVLGFGGYGELARVLRFLFAGEHEWNGARYTLDPDPYGRWIVVGNFITWIPGFEHMEALGRAARELAVHAGEFKAWAWDPVYDTKKAELRARLAPDEQRVWDVIAAPAAARIDVDAARELAAAFADAALTKDPGLDPRPRLGGIRSRVILTHGRQDRLIPFTETLRLTAMMPANVDVSSTVTGLFAHSAAGKMRHPIAWARETGRFVGLLDRALKSV